MPNDLHAPRGRLVLLIVLSLTLSITPPLFAQFEAPVSRPLDVTWPLDYVTHDFDQDGSSDLAVAAATGTGSRVNILVGDPQGQLKIEYELRFDVGLAAITAADINGDTIPDLIVTLAKTAEQPDSYCGTSGNNAIFVGDVFEGLPEFRFAGCISGASVQAFDANDDGFDDLLVDTRVLLGDGAGAFTETAVLSTDPPLQLGDGNGDGIADIFTTWGETYCGAGDGTFARCLLTAMAHGAVTDMNGDGLSDTVDAVATSFMQIPYTVVLFDFCGGGRTFYKVRGSGRGSGRYRPWRPTPGVRCRGTTTRYRTEIRTTAVQVVLNNGDGTTSTLLGPDVTGVIQSLIATDLDNDGTEDVLASLDDGHTVALFYGNGDGTLVGPDILDVPHGSQDLIVDDWNGDGYADIAWFDLPLETDHTLQVMFQVPPADASTSPPPEEPVPADQPTTPTTSSGETIEVEGAITGVEADSIVVEDVIVRYTDATTIKFEDGFGLSFAIGQPTQVKGTAHTDGSITAIKIQIGG